VNSGILLVLDRRELQVRVEHRSVRVDFPDGRFERFPPALLDAVVVHGSPMVRADVWRLLAEHRVPAALLPARGRASATWMGAGLGASVGTRKAQYAMAADASENIAMARWMVERKLLGYLGAAAEEQQATLAPRIRQWVSALPDCTEMASILGIEGSAARLWYTNLAKRLSPNWEFNGRNRRPPRDPVNAMLSLGYTLLTTVVHGRVEAAGLDPWLGFLHEAVPGRPALTLDVMEPLRPHVDRMVLGLTERGFDPGDFDSTVRDGCRLNKDARGRFYVAWADWARSCTDPFPQQEDGAGLSMPPETYRTEPRGLQSTARHLVRALRRHLLRRVAGRV